MTTEDKFVRPRVCWRGDGVGPDGGPATMRAEDRTTGRFAGSIVQVKEGGWQADGYTRCMYAHHPIPGATFALSTLKAAVRDRFVLLVEKEWREARGA